MSPARWAAVAYAVSAVGVWTALGVESATDDGGPPTKLQLDPWVKVVLVGVTGVVCAAPTAVVGYVIGVWARRRRQAGVTPGTSDRTPGAGP